jgi:hypothetical protein
MKAFLLLCSTLFILALPVSARSHTYTSQRILGTWRWVSTDGHPVTQPFYVRYEANRQATTWPAPKGWADSKGVSRGRYYVAHGQLILESGAGQNNPKSHLRIKGHWMLLTTDEGHRLLYRRVDAPIEPGRLENGSRAGYAKHSM